MTRLKLWRMKVTISYDEKKKKARDCFNYRSVCLMKNSL